MASSTIQVALRIPPALYDDVKIAAHGQQTSITRWVMAAMLEKLDRDSTAAARLRLG